MTIKEVEQRTGLTRSNIRFYEKEQLIIPARNEGNGYREYSEEDVSNLKKIAYLRTLGISIEDICKLLKKEADLFDVVKTQKGILEQNFSIRFYKFLLHMGREYCLDDNNYDSCVSRSTFFPVFACRNSYSVE